MNVQLTEIEIKGLCLKSREIFLSQPILLELEAPLKICGEYFYYKQSVFFACELSVSEGVRAFPNGFLISNSPLILCEKGCKNISFLKFEGTFAVSRNSIVRHYLCLNL